MPAPPRHRAKNRRPAVVPMDPDQRPGRRRKNAAARKTQIFTKQNSIHTPYDGARALMAIVCLNAVQAYRDGCPLARRFLLSERSRRWHELLGHDYRHVLDALGLLDEVTINH